MSKRSSGLTNVKPADIGEIPKRPAGPALLVKEKDIQKAILDYCHAMRIFVQRRNVAGIQKLNGDRYVRLGTKGMADLWGIAKSGRHWECEVKRPGNQPTPEQQQWLDNCAASGACAFWTASVDHFIDMARLYLV